MDLLDAVTNISPDKNDLFDLLNPKVFKCKKCGKEIKGEIPFKSHKRKCYESPKRSLGKQNDEPEVVNPPIELSRILRGKLLE